VPTPHAPPRTAEQIDPAIGDPVHGRAASGAADASGGLIDRAMAGVNRGVEIISSVALVLAGLVLTYSVVVRYFLKIGTDWQDEMSVFLIVGSVFMSAAAVQSVRGHIGIEAVASLLSPRANRVRQFGADLASLVFCIYFSWKSWTLLHEAAEGGFRSESTWGPPLWIPYSLLSVGMTLLSLQLLLQVLAPLRRARQPA
jgi:TRAP-type C4-dicarboxylate transport system permease small subunit